MKVNIRPQGSRIGVIEFSTPALTHVVFGLTSKNNYALEVNNAIDSIGYDNGAYMFNACNGHFKLSMELQQYHMYTEPK